MIIVLLVFLGGVLTILSPCILPVLPFVFARSEQKFLTSGLPLLIGMAVTFAGIATLAAVGGAWAVRVNQYGRLLALVLLTAFAATLLSRRLADRLARPFVALGNRLLPQAAARDAKAGLISSLLLGVATGLLWAPCAGPILGLVLTGAAISGPNTRTTLLLFSYAAGAATSLAMAILAGARVFAALKKSLGAGEWIRRGLGVAVLFAVAAIALGFDSTVLTRLSLAGTNRWEQSLIDKLKSGAAPQGGSATMAMSNTSLTGGNAMMMAAKPSGALPVEGEIPSFSGATAWLNSPALSSDALRGKVVLVDFWTYSCINCLRTLPYVKGWYEKYKDHGLVVVGVHAPEFAFEKSLDNVRQSARQQRGGERRQQNQRQQPAILIHTHRPGAAHGSQSGNTCKRHRHPDQQGQAARQEFLLRTRKDERQYRQDARTEYGQHTAQKYQQHYDHNFGSRLHVKESFALL